MWSCLSYHHITVKGHSPPGVLFYSSKLEDFNTEAEGVNELQPAGLRSYWWSWQLDLKRSWDLSSNSYNFNLQNLPAFDSDNGIAENNSSTWAIWFLLENFSIKKKKKAVHGSMHGITLIFPESIHSKTSEHYIFRKKNSFAFELCWQR